MTHLSYPQVIHILGKNAFHRNTWGKCDPIVIRAKFATHRTCEKPHPPKGVGPIQGIGLLQSRLILVQIGDAIPDDPSVRCNVIRPNVILLTVPAVLCDHTDPGDKQTENLTNDIGWHFTDTDEKGVPIPSTVGNSLSECVGCLALITVHHGIILL